jgi:formylglycine-generating enzyme required for sulfatase activity
MALRGRGLKVWLDEWELIPGRPWLDALEEVIESIACAAVLVGKDGLGPWELPEVRACLAEFVDRRLTVIPVLLPGAPQEPALPLLLRQFTWVDLRSGLTSEKLDHLQWGITGRKPDRREKLAAPRLAAVREREEPAKLDQTFTEPLTSIRFLWIRGGRFLMGGNAHADEQPLHWVRVSPFWLGETPVTNSQYAVFLEQTGYREPDYWHDGRFSSPDQPVVGVSWEDAQDFCLWLSQASGRSITLPSEAQWEFAARGADGRNYPWGNDVPDATRACFDSDQPSPVGSHPAGRGPFGTLDQAGNVWEWCLDGWDKKAYKKRAKKPKPDPVVEPQKGNEKRVIRGGGWVYPAECLRSAYRSWLPASDRYDDIGFRVAAGFGSSDG